MVLYDWQLELSRIDHCADDAKSEACVGPCNLCRDRYTVHLPPHFFYSPPLYLYYSSRRFNALRCETSTPRRR